MYALNITRTQRSAYNALVSLGPADAPAEATPPACRAAILSAEWSVPPLDNTPVR
jgi:hypothetical protein